MSETAAIKDLHSQVGLHLEALEDEGLSESDQVIVLRNFADLLKSWGKTLDKEAKHREARAFTAVQRRKQGLRKAA